MSGAGNIGETSTRQAGRRAPHDRFRGTGAGRALLRHIVDEARRRGITTLWLETGAEEYFAPARALYTSEGFVECGAFGSYLPDPHSRFMTRGL